MYLVLAGFGFHVARELGASWLVAVVAVAVPIVAMDALLGRLVRGKLQRFEKRLMEMLGAGQHDDLLTFYRGQHLLRFAAPRHVMQGKLALIHTRLGNVDLAAAAYREALDDAPAAESVPLALGLAARLHELGERDEAERVYRAAVNDEHVNAQACANLARLILERGGDMDEAETYLRAAVEAGHDGAIRCELVELLISRQNLADAREQLALAEKELASPDGEEPAALARARQRLDTADY